MMTSLQVIPRDNIIVRDVRLYLYKNLMVERTFSLLPLEKNVRLMRSLFRLSTLVTFEPINRFLNTVSTSCD